MSEDQAYKDGDIVWVKLGNNWWPGEVIDATRHPDGTVSHIKRKLYCIVKFFNEDAYEYVSNVKQIYPFQSAKKEEFLKKGFSLYNSGNKFMEKFPEDVKIAERLTRQKAPSLFINDRPDSIVKAILGQPIVLGGSSDGYGGSGTESVGGGNSTDYREKRRSCESITKIMNITPNKPKMGLPSPSLLSNSSSFSSSSSNNNAKNISTGDSISNRFNVGNNNANNNNNNYRCNLCGFTSVRQNVMILHRKSHSNRNSGGIGGTMASPHQNKTNIIDTNTKANKISVLKPSLLSTTTTTATSSTSIKMTAASKTLKTTLPVVAAAPRVKSNNDKVVNESFDSTKVLPALRSAATTTTTILISDTSSSELDVSSIDGTLARRSRRHTRTSASKTPPPAVVAANTPATIVTHNVLNGSKTTIKPADFLEQTKPIKKIPKKRDFASLHLQDAIENVVVLEQEIPLAADIIADAATSSPTAPILKDKTSASATKGNAEEIRNMLLADWSDEDETPDLEIGDDKREKSTKKDTKCATDSTVATATTSTPDMRGKTQNTSRIRNIPKKDRRNVILDDFNNDLSVIEPVASSSEINLADSSNSSFTAEVVEIVEQEQPEGETEAIITINDDDDGDEKEAALQEGMDKCKPTNQDKHSPQNTATSRHSELENHEPNDKSLTTSVLSCFDFQDDDEDEDIDAATNVVNTSVAHFKKKYLCNEKSLQPITTKDGGDNNMDSSHDKQQQQHEERAKQDQDLAAEIESLLEQTQPPAAADLIISRKASFEEGIAVKDLPIKERSKRIFKSRNRSRVVESKSSTESRTNSLSTDESLTKDNSSTVAAAIMEDITPKKPLVEDKSTRISSEQDKGYGQQHNGKNSKPCESMVGEANNETTPENLIEAATIQTLTKLAGIEENEPDDFNSEEMDVEKTHLNPGNKTRNNSLICLEDDIVAIIKQEKVNAEEPAQKITTAQETEERSPKAGDEDEDKVCENQLSDNTPVTNQEIEEELERVQGAPVIEEEVLKETQIEEEARGADKPIDKVQEVDLKQTILNTVLNENEEENDEAIEEHLDTQITEIPVTTEESEITTANAAETPGITMAEKKEHFTSDVDQLLTEDLPQQRQAVNTSPLDENSSLCASDTGAEFGSPASMLSEERLPAYPFSRNETPQPIEGNEIALAESESNEDDVKKQQSEVKDAEIIESKENDCPETKENVLTTKNRRRRLRGGKANSSKRKDLLKKSAERLKNSHQEEVAKDFVDSQEVLSADTNSIQDKPQRQQEEDEESKEEANYCETTSQEDTEKSKDEEEEEVNPSLEVNSSEKVNEEVSEDCIGESIICAKDASKDAVEKAVEICDTIENTKEASIETFENRAKVSDERECPIMLQESLDQDVPNEKPGNQPSNESNETESETKHINDKIEDSETNDNVLIKANINNAALEKVDEDNLQIPMEMSKCIKDLKETNDDEEEIVTKELGAQKSKEDESQLDNEANELRNDDMQLDDILLSKKENSESSMEYGNEIDTASLNDSAAVTSLESEKVLGTEAEVIQVEDITKKAEDKEEEEKGNDMKANESKSTDVLLESQRIVEAIDALEANMQKKSEIVTNLAENEDIMETPTEEKSHTKTPKKRGGDIIMPIKSKQRKQEEEEEVSLEEETLTNDLNKEEIFTECEKGSLKETEEPPESKKVVEDQNMESITTTIENLPTLEDATDSDIKENKEEETSWPIEETEISAIIEKALSSESHKATIDGTDAEASKEERSDPQNDHNSQTVNEKKNDDSEATTKPNPSTTEDLFMESLMEKTTTDYLKEFDKLMNQNQEQNVDNENEEIMKNIIIEVQMDNNVCRRIDTLGFAETIGDNESKSATSQKPTVSKTIKRRKTICFDTSVRPSSRKGPVYDFEECPPTTTTFATATATTTTTSRALKMKPLKRTAERKMTMPDIDRTTRRCEFAKELKTTCKSRRGSSLEDSITSFLLHRPSSGTHDEDDLVQDLFSDDTSSRLSMDAANVNTAEIQPRKLSTLHEAKQHNRNSTAADSNAPAKTPNGRNMKRKASQNKTISQRSVADNHPPQNKMARDVTATQSDHLKISDNQITTAQQQLMQLQQQQPQNQSSSIILNTQTSRTRKPHKTTTTAGNNQQPPPQNGNQLVVQQQQMQQQQQQVITQLASPQNIVLQPVLPQQANEGFIITTAGSREDENVIDSNTQLIALPTQPYPGYTETFLLCKVNGNTCKPVDNVPLYLNHQLNELVPIPAEVLEAGPKLIVADTSLNDSKEEEEDGNTQEAIMEQNKSHHDVLHRGGHKNDNSPGIHIANVTADEEDGEEEDGGVEGSDVGGTGIQQDFMDDITEANTNATMECTDDTANNGILLNIEGQQVLLDAATFAHLLANPDTNTQLISEDGTEYVLTHEVLQALYMQQQQQQQQQQHHHEQQVLEIANAAAGAGVNNDIIAVAMAGSDLYDNGVLTIDTTQALQLIEDGGGVVDGPVDGVIFQQATPTAAAPLVPPPHLTPPAVVTNAVLDQSPIMSTLEVPTNSRTHCISVPSTMAMVAPSNVVMGEVGGSPTNLDDSLAAIGVTAQSSSISSSLGLPITVTDPNIASKVTSAGPLNEILQFVSHRPATSQATAAALATAALAGESRIFND